MWKANIWKGGKSIQILTAHEENAHVTFVLNSPEDHYFVSCGTDLNVILWHGINRYPLQKLRVNSDSMVRCGVLTGAISATNTSEMGKQRSGEFKLLLGTRSNSMLVYTATVRKIFS